MRIYKLYKTTGSDIPNAVYTVNEDGSMTSFIFDENNTDYQAYLKWVSKGNTPEQAD